MHAVVGATVNKEKGGTDDSSIDSQLRVFLAHLDYCNVYCSWLYWQQWQEQKDLISLVDPLSSPGEFLP